MAILMLKCLKGIQVETWAGDTKLTLGVSREGDGDTRKVVWQAVVLIQMIGNQGFQVEMALLPLCFKSGGLMRCG